MADAVITVESLAKRYRLGQTTSGLFATLRRAVRAAWRANAGATSCGDRRFESADTLWALRDVSFAVRRGEVLGIIGRNGAGKSTLLKILSRITPPTAGRITLRGRVASLLEVGTGFHPELTGRDNIFLNGSILGMTRTEIRRRLPEIIEFAGIERFLDTPVKRYSSGMYVRLAFAVAAHLEPEILIVDEVLAVGDAAFQQKCLGKMQMIAHGGRTVLFVSHNMAAINHLCMRALLLREGRLVADDEPRLVTARYISESYSAARDRAFPRDPTKRMQIRQVALEGLPDGPDGLLDRRHALAVRVTYDVNEPTGGAVVGVMLELGDGTPVCHTRDTDGAAQRVVHRGPGCYEALVRFPGELLNAGTYTLRVGIGSHGGRESLDHQEALAFELHDGAGQITASSWGRPRPGVLYLTLPWTTARIDPERSASESELLSAPTAR